MALSFKVDYCSRRAATYAVEHYHYSKCMPLGTMVTFGVWEDSKFIGTLVYSRGSCGHEHEQFKIKFTEICELTRIALTTHKTSVSKIIAITLKMLHKKETDLKIIISYADPNHNHIGAIYQASNWAFIGTGGSKQEWRDRTGRIWHDREISKTGIKKVYGKRIRCPLPHELTKLILKPKWKYAYAFEPEIRQQLFKIAKPYPKSALVVQREGQPKTNGETARAIRDSIAPIKIS